MRDAAMLVFDALARRNAGAPRETQLILVDVVAAGPDGIDHRRRAVRIVEDALGVAIAATADTARPSGISLAIAPSVPEVVPYATAAGSASIVADWIVAGRTCRLQELTPHLVFAVLAPYLGADAATASARGIVPRTSSL